MIINWIFWLTLAVMALVITLKLVPSAWWDTARRSWKSRICKIPPWSAKLHNPSHRHLVLLPKTESRVHDPRLIVSAGINSGLTTQRANIHITNKTTCQIIQLKVQMVEITLRRITKIHIGSLSNLDSLLSSFPAMHWPIDNAKLQILN